MTLLLVTGMSGAGKSAVVRELAARGHRAVDTDDGLAAWYCTDTRSYLPIGEDPAGDPGDWIDRHEWRVSLPTVARLARDSCGSLAFLGGAVANRDELWQLVDGVVGLTADRATLRRRLRDRTSNSFGKHPEQLRRILSWHEAFEADLRARGATMVDATGPLGEVVEAVVAVGRQAAGATAGCRAGHGRHPCGQ